ncbi:MAG: molybdopterin converting factor subunit 1 [Alphaproteobacteria bacterium]|nr:molybdopterin converting factor subunit 1 [Alphaproteobacteria bacterium]
MKLLYFAWLRQKIGLGEETVSPPESASTPTALVDWLRTRGDGYALAFSDISAIKVAINQEFASFDDPISDGDEVAFFPPVTGG